eukprot:7197848-Prymnesium_polylepis.1
MALGLGLHVLALAPDDHIPVSYFARANAVLKELVPDHSAGTRCDFLTAAAHGFEVLHARLLSALPGNPKRAATMAFDSLFWPECPEHSTYLDAPPDARAHAVGQDLCAVACTAI